MRRITSLFLVTTCCFALAGCNGETAADKATTTTTMDAVDAVQGTISDEMIASDAITEQAPVAEGDENGSTDKKPEAKKPEAKKVIAEVKAE